MTGGGEGRSRIAGSCTLPLPLHLFICTTSDASVGAPGVHTQCILGALSGRRRCAAYWGGEDEVHLRHELDVYDAGIQDACLA